ncbi:MAG: OadG family transporter subunit [Hungatella sp.]
MKQNRKRVLLILCMLTCLISLSACSKAADSGSGMDPAISASLQQQTVGLLESIVVIPSEQLGLVVEQNRSGGAEAVALGLENYQGIAGELGAYLSSGEGSVTQTEDGYSITVDAVFEKRPVAFTIGLDKDMVNITSMSFSPVYSVVENLERAAMNTLMGMGTVFAVLIFISLLIGCFKYINVWEAKMKQESGQAPAAVAAPIVAVEEAPVDDTELIAVITAAISAAITETEGRAPEGLVVRSFRRASVSKWKNA